MLNVIIPLLKTYRYRRWKVRSSITWRRSQFWVARAWRAGTHQHCLGSWAGARALLRVLVSHFVVSVRGRPRLPVTAPTEPPEVGEVGLWQGPGQHPGGRHGLDLRQHEVPVLLNPRVFLVRLLWLVETHLVVQRHLVQWSLSTGASDGVSPNHPVRVVQVLPVIEGLRPLHSIDHIGVVQDERIIAGHTAVEVYNDLLWLVGVPRLCGLVGPENVLYFKVHAGLWADGGGAHGRARSGRLLSLRSIRFSPDVDVVYLWDVGGRGNGVGVLDSTN